MMGKRRFREIARRWHEETDFLSSPNDIVLNFNYQQIIGMGRAAVPLIIEDLKINGGGWYWALEAITGVDPVHPEDRGKTDKMKRAWMQWYDHPRSPS